MGPCMRGGLAGSNADSMSDMLQAFTSAGVPATPPLPEATAAGPDASCERDKSFAERSGASAWAKAAWAAAATEGSWCTLAPDPLLLSGCCSGREECSGKGKRACEPTLW